MSGGPGLRRMRTVRTVHLMRVEDELRTACGMFSSLLSLILQSPPCTYSRGHVLSLMHVSVRTGSPPGANK